jgi:hypothetical protein
MRRKARARSISKSGKCVLHQLPLVLFETDRRIVVTSSSSLVLLAIAESQRPKYEDDASRGCHDFDVSALLVLSLIVLLVS